MVADEEKNSEFDIEVDLEVVDQPVDLELDLKEVDTIYFDNQFITSIKKTASDGLIDTYTITLNDGRTELFYVTNGRSIISVKKTSTSDLADTYTITFNDNTYSTFDIEKLQLFDSTGGSTSGTMTQKAITTELSKKVSSISGIEEGLVNNSDPLNPKILHDATKTDVLDFNTEVLSRKNADTNLQSQITSLDSKITTEENSRMSADTNLQSQINNLNLAKANKSDVTEEISTAISSVVDSAPEAFDTLKEIADWIAEDETGTAALVERVGNIENKNNSQDTTIQSLQTQITGKVDKIEGKQLSSNDFTNEIKNNVESNSLARHTHNNKNLLDTYTQENSAIVDAVSKKHSHTNKDLLDSYTQENSDIADAVSKKHVHTNKTILDNTTASYTIEEKAKLEQIESAKLYTETGQNSDGSMTQKAVTDKINNIITNVDKIADSKGGFAAGANSSITGPTSGAAVGNSAKAQNGGAVGRSAETIDGGAVGYNAECFGMYIDNYYKSGDGGAIGGSAKTCQGGAIGYGAESGQGFAGGLNAKCYDESLVDSEGTLAAHIDAIQLGTGTNPSPKTLQIYDDNIYDATSHTLKTLNFLLNGGSIAYDPTTDTFTL